MARRRSGSVGGGVDPLWSKAPFLLLRYPGLFGSIALGTLLLALAASAYPLFISASASELVRARIEDPSYTRWAIGLSYRNGTMPVPGVVPTAVDDIPPALREEYPTAAERTARAFERLVRTDPYLAPPVVSMLGPVSDVALAEREGADREIRIFFGEGAAEQVEIVAGSAEGALVPDTTAEALGIEPGDEIVLGDGRRTATTRVGGIFRALYKGGASGYWRPWNDAVVLYCALCAPPPQPLLLPRAEFLRVAGAIGLERVSLALQAPIDGELTLEQAQDALRHSEGIIAAMTDAATPTGQLFSRCYLAGFCGSRVQATTGSAIDDVVREVRGRVVALEGPAKLLRAAGVLVAIAVVAGAGAFAMATRRVESTLLFARGARPSGVGVRSALEATLPILLGAALGLGVAFVLVRTVGPDGRPSAEATSQAAAAAAASAGIALFAIAIVSTASFLRRSEHHRTRFGALGALPWELGLAAAAIVVLSRLRSGGAVLVDPEFGTETPSAWLFVFPALFLAGFVGIAARATALALRWARNRSGGTGAATYLAVHRLAGRPRLAVLMITASGLCLGLFVQAQASARSMQATVDAKAGVFVGGDVQVRIDHGYETPERFPLPFTRVVREVQAGEVRTGVPFDLLAIDPDSFERAAFWEPAFADEPLETLIAPLERGGDEVPVVLVAWRGELPSSLTLHERTFPVDVVGTAGAFPGMTTLRPLVVVDASRLVEAFEGAPDPLNAVGASDELWIRGDADRALAAIPSLPYVPGLVLTAEEVKDIPYIAAVIDSFVVMNGLGLLALLLVIAAMLMYLQSRQRSAIVSHGLSLRMGMDRRTHFAAIAIELGAMLVVAFASASALGLVASRLIVPLLDPLEAVPPPPVTVTPLALLVPLATVLCLGALAGAWLTERRANAADLGQVMRLAD